MAPPVQWQPERYRPLLRLQVRQLELDPRLRRRFDSSDIVHDTLLKAHAHLGQCRAETEGVGALLDTLRTDQCRKSPVRRWCREGGGVGTRRGRDGQHPRCSPRRAERYGHRGG